MAIDYMADILGPNYGNVIAEPEYVAIDSALRNQASEQRILTTIEVLRSHLEILENRTEANLLLEAIARLTARVGSGGFIYDDEIVSVLGNVTNPSFAPGAGCSIEVGGVTTPIASPSGGNLAAVVAELNLALAGATAEISTFTAEADVAGSLGDKYITMNGPVGAPTDDYYAWFTHPGQAANEEITMVAANTLALSTTPYGPATEGSYWTFDTVGTNYFVWYDVQAQAEVTSISFKPGSGYTPELTHGVPPSVVGDSWDLNDLLGPSPGQEWRIWYSVEDPLIQDLTMPPAGTTGAPGWPGGGAPANYFKLEVPFGHPAFPGFYVWFDLVYAGGGNTDPGPPGAALPALAGYTGLRIELTAGPVFTAAALVTEILTNPGNLTTPGTTGLIPDPLAAGEFAGSTTLGFGVLEVWNTTPGANVLATDGFATGQAVWTGSPAAPPILTGGFPPPAGPNVAPAAGGRTLIPVVVSQLNSPTTVANSTDIAIGGTAADVASPVTGAGVITITQASAGAVVPIANSGGGLFIPPFIVTPGIDNNVVPTGGSTVGRTGIEVDVLWTDLAGGAPPNNVASKTGLAINNVDAIGAQWMATTEIRIQHQAAGSIGAGAADFNAGVAPLPPIAAGVDPATTDPAPGPANSVTVTIAVDDIASDVANKARLAIAAQAPAHFTVGGAGTAIQLTNTVGGNAPNATNGDTGWGTPVAVTDGTAGTPSAIESFVSGSFIGFRNTLANPDTPFTLIDGIGGILSPGGLAVGEYTTTKIEVANKGRDRALAVYEGQPRDPIL